MDQDSEQFPDVLTLCVLILNVVTIYYTGAQMHQGLAGRISSRI